MKKTKLKTLTLASLIVTGSIVTTVCDNSTGTIVKTVCGNSNSNFDPWNLSTWGSKKTEITNYFFNIEQLVFCINQTWQSFKGDFIETCFSQTFQTINLQASLNKEYSPNILYTYVNGVPPNNEIAKDVFKKGLLITFKGIKDGFNGEITINFQKNF